jgi:hypothetical protein
MRPITPAIPSRYQHILGDPAKISSSQPLAVNSFRELVEVAAEFAFENKDFLLFFRGQSKDYLNKGNNSTFYPTIYRGDYVSRRELTYRFDILEGCAKALSQSFEDRKIDGHKDVKRRKLIQWSILQHYEVCRTPLLDFTHSLRVACSFAHLNNNSGNAYVFMFGFPYLTNRISLNSEHDLVNVRLLSICPPQALRPHFQEGYLAGTDEVTDTYDGKPDLDFNNRLIVKIRIPDESTFWGSSYHRIPKESLYPSSDPIRELCEEIKEMASKELRSGDLGDLLKAWAEIEEIVISAARKGSERHLSFRQALNSIYEKDLLSKELYYSLNRIRTFRNNVVHAPKSIEGGAIHKFLVQSEDALRDLKTRI